MRLIVVLVVVLVAGCTGPASPDGEDEAASDGRVWAPSVRRIADNPNGQSEAVVSVSADGQTILSCMHGDFATPITVLVSRDAGVSWSTVAMPQDALPAGDCETTIFEDGRWGFAASSQQGASVYVTGDEGSTWTSDHQAAVGPYVVGSPVFTVDRPWIHAVGDRLWLAWMPGKDTPGTVMTRFSDDGAASWSTPAPLDGFGPATTNVRHGHPVPTDAGLEIPLMRYQVVREDTQATGFRSLEIASSSDGASWRVDEVLADKRLVPDWPSLAVTGDGHRVLLFIYTLDSGSRGIAAMVQPPGEGWSEPFGIHDPGAAESTWPWVDGGLGSRATFVFHGADVNGTKAVWMGSLDARSRNVTMWPVGQGLVEFASVDHAADGTAVAAWTIGDEAQYVARLAAPRADAGTDAA